MSSGMDEVLCVRGILTDLKITYEEPIKVFCGKKSAISIAHDPMYHNMIEHMNIDKYCIKEKLGEMILSTIYINSSEQCANISTNGLSTKMFSKFLSKLGNFDHSSAGLNTPLHCTRDGASKK